MRISELKEYTQRDVSQVQRPRTVASSYVPNAAATAALMRRNYDNGLALTEQGPQRQRQTSLGGLGELVQVVF